MNFEEIEEFRKNAIISMNEVKETCDYISNLCKENIEILNNPYKFAFESEKIVRNQAKIDLRLASLGSFADAMNELEGGDD